MIPIMRPINYLIIHCAASPNGNSLTQYQSNKPAIAANIVRTPAQTIDSWHQARGFHRSPTQVKAFNPHLLAIGYHLVIGIDGTVFTGRDYVEVGAHAVGHNAYSVGICLVGTDRFSHAQWQALRACVKELSARFAVPCTAASFNKDGTLLAKGICGHRDLVGVAKTCPGFSVAQWLQQDLQALDDHLLIPS